MTVVCAPVCQHELPQAYKILYALFVVGVCRTDDFRPRSFFVNSYLCHAMWFIIFYKRTPRIDFYYRKMYDNFLDLPTFFYKKRLSKRGLLKLHKRVHITSKYIMLWKTNRVRALQRTTAVVKIRTINVGELRLFFFASFKSSLIGRWRHI